MKSSTFLLPNRILHSPGWHGLSIALVAPSLQTSPSQDRAFDRFSGFSDVSIPRPSLRAPYRDAAASRIPNPTSFIKHAFRLPTIALPSTLPSSPKRFPGGSECLLAPSFQACPTSNPSRRPHPAPQRAPAMRRWAVGSVVPKFGRAAAPSQNSEHRPRPLIASSPNTEYCAGNDNDMRHTTADAGPTVSSSSSPLMHRPADPIVRAVPLLVASPRVSVRFSYVQLMALDYGGRGSSRICTRSPTPRPGRVIEISSHRNRVLASRLLLVLIRPRLRLRQVLSISPAPSPTFGQEEGGTLPLPLPR